MIEKLLNEMFVDCPVCHEGYTYPEDDFNAEAVECPNCCGEGKVISYQGEQLRHVILKGELP